MSNDKREYYRIEYQAGEGPRFETGGLICPVCNLSEGGLAYRAIGGSTLTKGMKVRGTLVMPDRTRFPITGSVTRVTTLRVAIKFNAMIPLATIMKEQRRLIQASKVD